MRDIYTDRDYFDDKFKTISNSFDGIIKRLDKLNNDKIPIIEKRIDCLEKINDIDDEIKKRWWQKYKRTIEIAGIIVAFLTLFYMNWSDKHLIKQVREETCVTNQILAPEAVKRGFNLDSLGLNE